MWTFLTSDLVKNLVGSGVRHGAALLGAYLIHEGVITQSQNQDLLGSLLCLFGIAWSLGRHIITKLNAVPTAPKEPPHV